MPDDDCPLADRIAQARQDPQAFAWLLEHYREFLLGQAEKAMGFSPPPDLSVSDLVQDTFLEAYLAFVNFRGTTEASLLNWFKTILKNNVRDRWRKKRIPVVPLEDKSGGQQPPGDDTSPTKRVVRGERENRLTAALSQLPERQRLAVMLYHLQDLSLEEVAAELGCTTTAAAGLVKRGLKGLNQKLGPESSL